MTDEDRQFEAVAVLIEGARGPEDVFGASGSTTIIHDGFKKAVRYVHPDRPAIQDKDRARRAFIRLGELKAEGEAKLAAGTYGQRNVSAPSPAPAPVHPATKVETKQRVYLVDQPFAHGDLADLYDSSYTEKATGGLGPVKVVFKIVRSAADNDLMETEQKTLTWLFKDSKAAIEKAKAQKKGSFYSYLPRLEESFMMKAPSGSNRRVNILEPATDFISLAEVMRAYPKGADYRDVVWMFKRMLVGAGFAHTKGVVHGAIIPPHVLVHPVNHGAKIIDWCYAIRGKGRVPAISKEWKKFYAPEIFKKETPSAATDIYMIGKTAIALMGGNLETNKVPLTVPRPLQGFLESLVVPLPNRRPQDAWKLHEELDELLLRVVGKPRYRPLVIPAKS